MTFENKGIALIDQNKNFLVPIDEDENDEHCSPLKRKSEKKDSARSVEYLSPNKN
jgi:hypothetical protein